MKIVEVEMEDQTFEDLKMTSSKISFNDLRKQIARAEASGALEECHKAAREEGLDKMSEEDIITLVKEARANYDKSNN